MKQISEYLYYLLPSALKRIPKKLNCFWILFQVLGRHCGEIKDTILNVREMSMLSTCPPELLPVFGEERDMPRLRGESLDAYRKRLMMKAQIAEMAGTASGVRLALASLGYEQSRIEPFYLHDPERWAEFIVFLRGAAPGAVNDLSIIDNEVMKVKQASSLPLYASESERQIKASSARPSHDVYIPLCGITMCGKWPGDAGYGVTVTDMIHISRDMGDAAFGYPMTGMILTSDEFYVYAEE